jgi:hypothetical protein
MRSIYRGIFWDGDLGKEIFSLNLIGTMISFSFKERAYWQFILNETNILKRIMCILEYCSCFAIGSFYIVIFLYQKSKNDILF